MHSTYGGRSEWILGPRWFLRYSHIRRASVRGMPNVWSSAARPLILYMQEENHAQSRCSICRK